MIEGGGNVINSMLGSSYRSLVDSVIVTVAPLWLGRGGVFVSPERTEDEVSRDQPAMQLSNVSWHALGSDIVMCGKPLSKEIDATV